MAGKHSIFHGVCHYSMLDQDYMRLDHATRLTAFGSSIAVVKSNVCATSKNEAIKASMYTTRRDKTSTILSSR